MKHLSYSLLGIIMLLALVLTACGAPADGPQAWLDWPLDKTTVPLAPLTIQTHASDEDGVAQFEFYANDTPLFIVDSDGSRLGEAVVEWTPPGPGIYSIRVHAIDSGGNIGSDATAIVTVSGGQLATEPPPLTLAETATTFAQPVDTETPAPGGNNQCTLSQLVAPVLQTPADYDNVNTPVYFAWSDLPYAEIGCHPHSWRVDISLYSNFSDTSWGFGTLNHLETSRSWPLPVGNCYYWRVLAYVPDNYGPPSPTRYFCVPEPEPAPPVVTEALPVATEPPPVVTEPPLITDTTPPSFFSTGVSPDKIYHQVCAGDHVVTVAAAITDESGLSSVVAYWNISGTESGQVNLQEVDQHIYSAEIGPVSTVGTMEVYITAWDNYGNVAQSDTMYVTVINCIN